MARRRAARIGLLVLLLASTARGETADAWRAGTASWYGAAFAGRPTASGEIFRPDGLTAAHRTLRIGTIVRVTNLRNGRSVVVRINDRGPYWGEREIDLSRGAARELDMVEQGLAPVLIELRAPASAVRAAR